MQHIPKSYTPSDPKYRILEAYKLDPKYKIFHTTQYTSSFILLFFHTTQYTHSFISLFLSHLINYWNHDLKALHVELGSCFEYGGNHEVFAGNIGTLSTLSCWVSGHKLSWAKTKVRINIPKLVV